MTARLLSGATERSTGSLTAGAPGGMVKLALPLKVNGRSEPATMDEPGPASAIWAAPMVTGAVPYSFDSTTRTREPPMLT